MTRAEILKDIEVCKKNLATLEEVAERTGDYDNIGYRMGVAANKREIAELEQRLRDL